ncbi:hypothetical protein [Gordonia crocea]|uniref:Uncharacterized protein n=1 Tax=Gordonia crocea TaxID=589162 RepID=A0A7I9UVT7_9ACTN|nr:hypothetical protein [Gordonia crocea]GED96890.1 hypothetical protein nbrc107697_09290 [Gordonia crocea]
MSRIELTINVVDDGEQATTVTCCTPAEETAAAEQAREASAGQCGCACC